MDAQELEKLVSAHDEQLLSDYGAQLRARNAAHSERLAQQIARAALADIQAQPAQRAGRAASQRQVQTHTASGGPRLTLTDLLMGGRRGFAIASAMLLLAIGLFGFIGFGGRPASSKANAVTSRPGAHISLYHSGPFGLTWRTPLILNLDGAVGLTVNDEVQTDASTLVTLTFTSGTQSVISPNSLVRVDAVTPFSVRVLHGEVAAYVRPPTVLGVPSFVVNTERGSYTARGTIYHVQVGSNEDRIKTREGTVSVHTGAHEQLVAYGVQADVSDAGIITPHISLPSVELRLNSDKAAHEGDSVTTNVREAIAVISTAANARVAATLTTLGHETPITTPLNADKTGNVTLPMRLPEQDGIAVLKVTVTDTSGQNLGVATSQPITIVVDRKPPSRFRLTEPVNNVAPNSPAHIVGVTEPNALVTVNGTSIMADTEGRFNIDLTLKPGPNAVEFIVTNAAGNSLRVEETVYLLR
jgi:ferric-dicitrate binding protein FerR (iron transport regulator)